MQKIDYYSNTDYISQSDLKRVIGKPYDNPSEVGNLVDMMCTEPHRKDEYLVTKSKVTPALKALWDKVIIYCDEITPESVFKTNNGVYGNGSSKYTVERIYKDLMKYEDYKEDFMTGKKVVTPTEWFESERMATIIQKHPRTQFLKDAETQVDIYNDNFYGHKVKGRLDYWLNKNQVIDLKSVHSMAFYKKNLWKFRYELQTTWYSDISGSTKRAMIVFVAPDADYPLVIKLKPETMLMARVGGYRINETLVVQGKKYPQKKYVYGYLDLLTQYEELKSRTYSYPPNDYETIIHGYKEI